MKKIIETTDAEGLEKLLGERVTLFCLNYFYTGELAGVNADCVLLRTPQIVYETGSFTNKAWQIAEALPGDLYVMKSAIESFGVVK